MAGASHLAPQLNRSFTLTLGPNRTTTTNLSFTLTQGPTPTTTTTLTLTATLTLTLTRCVAPRAAMLSITRASDNCCRWTPDGASALPSYHPYCPHCRPLTPSPSPSPSPNPNPDPNSSPNPSPGPTSHQVPALPRTPRALRWRGFCRCRGRGRGAPGVRRSGRGVASVQRGPVCGAKGLREVQSYLTVTQAARRFSSSRLYFKT